MKKKLFVFSGTSEQELLSMDPIEAIRALGYSVTTTENKTNGKWEWDLHRLPIQKPMTALLCETKRQAQWDALNHILKNLNELPDDKHSS